MSGITPWDFWLAVTINTYPMRAMRLWMHYWEASVEGIGTYPPRKPCKLSPHLEFVLAN